MYDVALLNFLSCVRELSSLRWQKRERKHLPVISPGEVRGTGRPAQFAEGLLVKIRPPVKRVSDKMGFSHSFVPEEVERP